MDTMRTHKVPNNEAVKFVEEKSSEGAHDCEMCSRFGTREVVQEMIERDRRSDERKARRSKAQ